MRHICDKVSPDLVKLLQLSDIVEKNDCPGHFILSVLDWDGADFDMPLAVGSRIGQTQLASRRFPSEQRFRNHLIQRGMTDGFNQRNADCRIGQFEHFLKSRIRQRNAAARIDYVEIVDADSLEPVADVSANAVLLLAVYIGKTRLIDNLRFA